MGHLGGRPGDRYGELAERRQRVQVETRPRRPDGNWQSKRPIAAPTGNVASDSLVTVVPAGTSAAIHGTVVAGGGVHVRAKDSLDVNGLAGAVAGGFVGVGAAILILNVASQTDASIAAGSSITAGSGDVSVEARMDEKVNGLAFSGAIGAVAVGAQVVVLNDTGTQNAHIDDGAAIHQAAGGVFVTTTANREVDVEAIGAALGVGATGASVAVSNVSGNATAFVGNVTLGDTGPVGGLTVSATDSLSAPTLAIAVEGGIGVGISGAVAFSTLKGTTSATSGAHGTVGAGGVTVTATGTHTVKANTVNVSTGVFAAGLTIAHASNGRSTNATVTSTGNIATTGAVLVKANGTNETEATAPGGSAGGVTIDILVPIAETTGDTLAQVDGSFSGASSITIQAWASNHAKASVTVFGVSVAGLTGAFAEATVSSNVQANVGSGSSLGSTGAVLVEAKLIGPKQNNAEATALGASGGVILSGSVMVTSATVSGNLVAGLGGSVTGSSSITVRAQGAATATATTTIFGIGTFSGAGGGAGAEVSGNTNATTGSGKFTSSGAVLVTAISANTATASSDIGAGGLFSVGVSLPTATVSGRTLAQLNADVDPTAVEISASSANHATATSEVVHIGLFSGAGTKADATVDAGASTQALVGASSSIVASGAVQVLATSDNNATVHVPGGGGGLVGVNFMFPTATVAGSTKAHLDGDVSAGSLTVRSSTANTATADAHVTSIQLLGSASGIVADAEITSAAGNEASIGSSSTVSVSGGVDVESIQSGANAATASAAGTGTGIISGGVFVAVAIVGGGQLAEIDGDITSSSLIANATGANTAQATTASFGIGAVSFSGAGTLARVASSADVNAKVGSTASVHGSISVTANSANTATSTSDAASGGLVGVSVNLPEAKSPARRWPSSTAMRARPTRSSSRRRRRTTRPRLLTSSRSA